MLKPETKRELRSQVSAVARQLGLLQSLDWMNCAWVRFKNRSRNRTFKTTHPDFPTPPATLAYDAYGGVDWPAYFVAGRQTAEEIGRIIAQYLPPGPVRYL